MAGSTVEETRELIEAALAPSEPVYEPTVDDPPVAMLIDGEPRSAAEYVTVAFIGRDNTQTFGQTTFGVPTGVGGAQFIDGGVLVLAGIAPADRLGRSYTSNIFPDNVIAPSPSGEDQTLDAALESLATQPSCSGRTLRHHRGASPTMSARREYFWPHSAPKGELSPEVVRTIRPTE